ncbi:MAG: efflux RND transporter periplasmic adaptor subunit [Pseudomonadota bacterium]
MLQENRWLMPVAVALIAAGAGFGVARLTAFQTPAPVAAPAPEGPAALKIASREVAAAGIRVAPATNGNLNAEILAPAITTAQPQGVASLSAHAEGVISRLDKRLGDAVRAGEILALVDSKDAAQIASDRASAEARAVLARRVAQQEEALLHEGATSRRSLQTAQASLAAAEADARRARNAAAIAGLSSDGHSVAVISPLSGRITAQAAALGAFVRTETELFRISDPNLVQVEAQMTALDAARVRPGDPASLMLPSGAVVQASVRSVTPALDPQTRTQTAVLSVPEGVALAPGETLQVRISPKSMMTNGIVIPEEAVQVLDGRDAVFARTADGFVVRHVAVGSRGAGRAAIISGLRPGEVIATRNAFLLKAELGKGAGDDE